MSHGRNYNGPKISDNPWKEGTEQPWVLWVPSIAVTGGTFYTGDAFPGWRRSLFVGGLRQGERPRTGQMQRIEFNDKWEEIRREPLLGSCTSASGTCGRGRTGSCTWRPVRTPERS